MLFGVCENYTNLNALLNSLKELLQVSPERLCNVPIRPKDRRDLLQCLASSHPSAPAAAAFTPSPPPRQRSRSRVQSTSAGISPATRPVSWAAAFQGVPSPVLPVLQVSAGITAFGVSRTAGIAGSFSGSSRAQSAGALPAS